MVIEQCELSQIYIAAFLGHSDGGAARLLLQVLSPALPAFLPSSIPPTCGLSLSLSLQLVIRLM